MGIILKKKSKNNFQTNLLKVTTYKFNLKTLKNGIY